MLGRVRFFGKTEDHGVLILECINGVCVSLLNRLIQDHTDDDDEVTEESTLGKNSPVP